MYRHVAVFELDGTFLGYTIMGQGANKLQTTNIYSEAEGTELAEQLVRLNGAQQITAHWPDARDPEVHALVQDPAFEPVEMVVEDVIDEDNSYIKFIPETDAEGKEVPGTRIDLEASVLRYKKESVPKEPALYLARTKKAQQIVAERRMA